MMNAGCAKGRDISASRNWFRSPKHLSRFTLSPSLALPLSLSLSLALPLSSVPVCCHRCRSSISLICSELRNLEYKGRCKHQEEPMEVSNYVVSKIVRKTMSIIRQTMKECRQNAMMFLLTLKELLCVQLHWKDRLLGLDKVIQYELSRDKSSLFVSF
ncbi:hypothetical protein Cgig2_002706 [Carnegiea gigantea]|uniref:Uncharacterized protein n=1 Tax=Carnegiea gigantea TaxID=171969 RepID=A0A9Q1KQ09_9CARY|nr:hypothetical protein Cgig2_002706 [Carnegiea gigantea]